MILCDEVDCGERASGLTGNLETRQVSLSSLGKQRANTGRGFAFEFWDPVVVQSHSLWIPAESSMVWPGPSERLPAPLNLPGENLPAVKTPPPWPQGLSQPSLVLLLCKAASGQGQAPGHPSETRDLPAQLSSGQALLLREVKEAKSCSCIPPVTGGALCGPPSGAMSLGLKAMNSFFFSNNCWIRNA